MFPAAVNNTTTMTEMKKSNSLICNFIPRQVEAMMGFMIKKRSTYIVLITMAKLTGRLIFSKLIIVVTWNG